MMIVVTGGFIRVDGIQYGIEYSSHALALNIAHQVHEQHYPHARFVDIPETSAPAKSHNHSPHPLRVYSHSQDSRVTV